VIRKETQGVTEYAGSLELKNPDGWFRNRDAVALARTGGMSLRTKGWFRRTVREPRPRSARVRPLEVCFLGFAAAGGLLLPAGGCGSEGPESPRATLARAAVTVPAPTPTAAPDPFVTSVRPILVAHCAPCHEPGGRLYEKLPFDDPSVVTAHEAGILRRLKGEDRAAIEKWVAALPHRASPGR
jgi:hypothetical protein